MPYIGEQSVDFSVSDDRPVILIRGENNRGKSSLFAAIRWCLYGKVLGRADQNIPNERLLNDNAFELGRDSFQVELNFSHEGDDFTLIRSCVISRDQKNNRKSSNTRVYLQKGRDTVASEDVMKYVTEALNEKISMFFLCDMEVLQGYENLVIDESMAAVEVKNAIEDILGVPSLIKIRDNLNEIVAESYKEIQKANKANKDLTEIEIKHAEQSAKHKKAKESLEEANAKIKEKKAELDVLTNELEKISDAKEFIERERSLIEANNDATKKIDAARKEIQLALHESWWAPVANQVELKVEQTQEFTKIASQRHQAVTEKTIKVVSLKTSLDTNICGECRQNLPADHISQTKSQILEIEREIAELSKPLIPSLESLVDETKRLGLFRMPRKAEVIASLEKSIRILQNEIPKRSQQIKEISESLKGINRDLVKELEIQRRNKDREIGAIAVILKTEQAKFSNSEKELKSLNTEFAKIPREAGEGESSLEMAMATHLQSIFEETVAKFRDSMKTRVEENATEVFSRLRTENVVSGLKINENYGLRLMDAKGKVFDHRGAGVEQIVALSLILGLARSASRPNALVLDTPFARLDVNHRDNILKFIPSESKQVILLIQSAEEISKKVEDDFMRKVSREYTISMGSDQKESFIKVTA